MSQKGRDVARSAEKNEEMNVVGMIGEVTLIENVSIVVTSAIIDVTEINTDKSRVEVIIAFINHTIKIISEI